MKFNNNEEIEDGEINEKDQIELQRFKISSLKELLGIDDNDLNNKVNNNEQLKEDIKEYVDKDIQLKRKEYAIKEKKIVDSILSARELPEGWEILYDSTSKSIYYWNKYSNETSWEKPIKYKIDKNIDENINVIDNIDEVLPSNLNDDSKISISIEDVSYNLNEIVKENDEDDKIEEEEIKQIVNIDNEIHLLNVEEIEKYNEENEKVNNIINNAYKEYNSDRIELWTRPEPEIYLTPYLMKIITDAANDINILIPETKKQFDVILHTAKSTRENRQLEIFIKVKQADNALFDFLNFDNNLLPIYNVIKSLPEDKFWSLLLEKELPSSSSSSLSSSLESNVKEEDNKDIGKSYFDYGDDESDNDDNNNADSSNISNNNKNDSNKVDNDTSDNLINEKEVENCNDEDDSNDTDYSIDNDNYTNENVQKKEKENKTKRNIDDHFSPRDVQLIKESEVLDYDNSEEINLNQGDKLKQETLLHAKLFASNNNNNNNNNLIIINENISKEKSDSIRTRSNSKENNSNSRSSSSDSEDRSIHNNFSNINRSTSYDRNKVLDSFYYDRSERNSSNNDRRSYKRSRSRSRSRSRDYYKRRERSKESNNYSDKINQDERLIPISSMESGQFITTNCSNSLRDKIKNLLQTKDFQTNINHFSFINSRSFSNKGLELSSDFESKLLEKASLLRKKLLNKNNN